MTTWERVTAAGGVMVALAYIAFGGSDPSAVQRPAGVTSTVVSSVETPTCADPGTGTVDVAELRAPHHVRGTMRAI